MDPFEMVIAIVALSLTAGLVDKFMKLRLKNKTGLSDTKLEDILGQLQNMEQRMRVVEEIVSSSSYELRQELSELEKPTGDRV